MPKTKKQALRRDAFTTLSPDRCQKAAAALERAFQWGESAEGFDYWAAVYDRLRALSKQKE